MQGWKKISKNILEISKAATRGVLYKKGVLRNFLEFTGKHLCQLSCRPEALAKVFSCEFYEIFKNIFFTEHLWTTVSEIYY